MSQVSFSDPMPRTRQVFWGSTLFLVLLAGLSGVVYLYTGSQNILLLQVFSTLAAFLFLASLLFFWFYYQRKPEVKQKRSLLKQLKKVQKEQDLAQEELAQVLQLEENVRQESRAKQEKERESLNSILTENDQQLNALRVARQAHLHQALEQLKLAHLEAGLKTKELEPTDIPGIGEVLITKLHAAGVHSAYDVNNEHIQGIPSFGESKALSLVRWREALENDIRKTQPDALPGELQRQIEEEYTAQFAKLVDEKEQAQRVFEERLQTISSQEAEQVAKALTRQTVVRQNLPELEMAKQEVQSQVDLYDQVTFREMLSSALFTGSLNWQKRILSSLAFLAYLVFGMLNLAILVYVWLLLKPGI